jgi:hypothetical protein
MVRAVLAVVLLAVAAPALVQVRVGEVGRREAQYGTPAELSLEEIVQESAGLDGRAVRTRGRLGLQTTFDARGYVLREPGAEVAIEPLSQVEGDFERDAGRWMGHRIEVTGVFSVELLGGANPLYSIRFWRVVGPPEEDAKKEKGPSELTLGELLSRPGERDGQTIRVAGRFRGRNLYEDLPTASQRGIRDWVIKDDRYAVWVTGRPPRGRGFELDPLLKGDTGKWVEVVGRPRTRNGVTYVKAQRVALAFAPRSQALPAVPAAPVPDRPKAPPVIVFAMPLDGASEVPRNTRFVVQFSGDMDEATFEGRVGLRYPGPDGGEQAGVTYRYDPGKRSLTVDPGGPLRSNRQIELRLLPGIADVHGLGLGPRPGRDLVDGAEVLVFRVGS